MVKPHIRLKVKHPYLNVVTLNEYRESYLNAETAQVVEEIAEIYAENAIKSILCIMIDEKGCAHYRKFCDNNPFSMIGALEDVKYLMHKELDRANGTN